MKQCVCVSLSLSSKQVAKLISFSFPLFWHLKKSQVSRLTEWNMFFEIFSFSSFVLKFWMQILAFSIPFFGFCVTVKMQNFCHVYSSKLFKINLERLDCQGLKFAHFRITKSKSKNEISYCFLFRICLELFSSTFYGEENNFTAKCTSVKMSTKCPIDYLFLNW